MFSMRVIITRSNAGSEAGRTEKAGTGQSMESKPAVRAAMAFLYQFSFNTLLALFWAAIYKGIGFSENFFFARV
jgi:hypothetical protein